MKGSFPLLGELPPGLDSWAGFLRSVDFLDKEDFTFQSWEPAYSAGGSMTFTAVTTNYARYIKIGKFIVILIQATGTTGGVASNTITFTAPFVASNPFVAGFAGTLVDTAGVISGTAGIASGSKVVSVNRYDTANWGLGAGRLIRVLGIYEGN